MQKYTYINLRNGKRIHSDKPLNDPTLKLVAQIRGGVPRGVEKS